MLACLTISVIRTFQAMRSSNYTRDSISKGDRIEVPIEHVRVRAKKLPGRDAAAKQRIAKRQKVQVLAERRLDEAYDAWRGGKYEVVTEKLVKLEIAYVDADTAAQIAVLLGRTHIAFGNRSAAKQAFARALERQPSYTLSPRDISPIVLEVWKQAGGGVTQSSQE